MVAYLTYTEITDAIRLIDSAASERFFEIYTRQDKSWPAKVPDALNQFGQELGLPIMGKTDAETLDWILDDLLRKKKPRPFPAGNCPMTTSPLKGSW